MKKINWINVIKLIIAIICLCTILHDAYMLTIYSSITGKLYGWSWIGFITFIFCLYYIGYFYVDFEEKRAETLGNVSSSKCK